MAQDPATGRDVGNFEAPAASVAGHAQYVLRAPNGLIVTVPLQDDGGMPVAFRTG